MVSWKMGSWPGMAPHRSAEMASMLWPTLGSPLPAEEKEDEDGDCDAHIAGLAEQIAHSMLEDDEEEGKQGSSRNTPSVLQQAKAAWNAQVSVPCSFQSTTAGLSLCNWELKRAETLMLLSQLSSPLQQRIEKEALELLYAELVRLKMEEKMRALAATQRHSFYPKPFNMSPEGFSQSMGSSLNPAVHYHSFVGRLQNQQFHARKQAGANWAALNSNHRSGKGDSRHRTGGETVDPSYSCYQQYCNNGSGMRAVSLGAPSSRESGGTGVFLPRSRTGSRNIVLERKRKPASSTVLLPSRIVHALNLNVEDTLSAPVSASTINPAAHREFPSPAPAWRRDTYNSTRRTDSIEEWPSLHHPSCSPLQEVAPDISLPTEWTY